MTEILLLFLAAGAVGVWLDQQRARENAIARARQACQAQNGQFLDDSVVLMGWKLVRGSRGNLVFQRQFGFEFSLEGWVRRSGWVVMEGAYLKQLHLELPETNLIEAE